ncbi:MAG: recombination-associated protein RdgC [Thiolinea sp.]
MWFKNLYLYKLQDAFPFSAEELDELLARRPFVPCNSEQRESLGWVAPLGRDAEAMVHAANGYLLLSMAHQERMLPSSVIKEELDERVADLQEREGRKVGGREKKDLRDQIEFELLPRAFTRTRRLDAWIDPQALWLVINTGSATQAERLTTHLRKAVDSLPVKTPESEQPVGQLLTHWLTEGVLPAPFEFGEECELRSQGDDQSVAVFKKHELTADEVRSNLESGKRVSKLMLVWADKISFVLTEDLQIKRLKFLDVFAERLDEQDPQSHAERVDIEFSLMTGEVAQLLIDLFACFKTQGE